MGRGGREGRGGLLCTTSAALARRLAVAIPLLCAAAAGVPPASAVSGVDAARGLRHHRLLLPHLPPSLLVHSSSAPCLELGAGDRPALILLPFLLILHPRLGQLERVPAWAASQQPQHRGRAGVTAGCCVDAVGMRAQSMWWADGCCMVNVHRACVGCEVVSVRGRIRVRA